MTNLKPELQVLPFMALITGTSNHLTIEQTMSMLRRRNASASSAVIQARPIHRLADLPPLTQEIRV